MSTCPLHLATRVTVSREPNALLMLEMPTLMSDGCAALSKRTVREPDRRIEHVPLAQDASQKSVSGTGIFQRPTSDTGDIAAAVVRIFERIWRNCNRWRKAGALLLDLGVPGQAPASLFDVMEPPEDRLMQAIDQINARYARGTARLGLAQKDSECRMRRENLSPSSLHAGRTFRRSNWIEVEAQVASRASRFARRWPRSEAGDGGMCTQAEKCL